VSAAAERARVAVFQRRLKSLAYEMSRTLYRTTRSPLLRNGDFAVGFLDAAGGMLEQDEHLPLMAFSLAPGCQYLMGAFGDDIHDGDVFIHNDVWANNIQHADTGFYVPLFLDGELVAWTACRGHWVDIGGAVRGTSNPEATEVFQEALRIPPTKIVDRGVERRDVWELIFANVRMREIVEADARAQRGACHVGERALRRFVAHHGVAAFRRDVELLYDATERAVRAELRELPDGVYAGESTVRRERPDGVTGSTIRVSLDVSGDRLAIDFAGTDPQVPSFLNSSETGARAAAYVALLYVLSPEVLHNEGLVRTIDITVPEGSVLAARYPAATFMGNKLSWHVSEAVMLALGERLPDRVTAAWARRLTFNISGTDPRTGAAFHDVYFLTYEGGGAMAGLDGYNQPGLLGCGNVLSQDYEEFERQNPVRLLAHEYRADSGGAGRWRGGLGTRTRVRYLGEDTDAITHGDGTLEPPQGLAGGHPGTLNAVWLIGPDGRKRRAYAHEVLGRLAPGTVSVHDGGGGGGFGPPEERQLAAVQADVVNGVVSVEAALTSYGVVITADGTVDREATERRRAHSSTVST
jgi:N-methylhydantoinase B